MKRLIILLSVLLTAMSCTKHEKGECSSCSDQQLYISFDSSDITSRADLFDEPQTESWEKEVKSLSVYIFSHSQPLYWRKATAAELSAGKMILTDVPLVPGSLYRVFLLANADIQAPAGEKDLYELIDPVHINDYNFSDAVVMTRLGKRAGGFVMTAQTDYIHSRAVNQINIALKRVAAKMIVRVSIDKSLGVDRISLREGYASGTIPHAYLFNANVKAVEKDGTGTTRQNPMDPGHPYSYYICYLNEIEPQDEGEIPRFVIEAQVREDDGKGGYQSEIKPFSFPIEGEGKGVINRNGLYLVDVHFSELFSDVVMSYRTVEWQTGFEGGGVLFGDQQSDDISVYEHPLRFPGYITYGETLEGVITAPNAVFGGAKYRIEIESGFRSDLLVNGIQAYRDQAKEWFDIDPSGTAEFSLQFTQNSIYGADPFTYRIIVMDKNGRESIATRSHQPLNSLTFLYMSRAMSEVTFPGAVFMTAPENNYGYDSGVCAWFIASKLHVGYTMSPFYLLVSFSEPLTGTVSSDFTSISYIGTRSNYTVACQYEYKTVLVTYDSNGGSGERRYTINAGSKHMVLDGYIVSHLSKRFAHWSTSADGKSDVIMPGQVITLSDKMTLYAQWVDGTTP